jgi:RNase P subunit RPR2
MPRACGINIDPTDELVMFAIDTYSMPCDVCEKPTGGRRYTFRTRRGELRWLCRECAEATMFPHGRRV